MTEQVGATTAQGTQNTPIYHFFKDDTSETPQGYDTYKVFTDSNEGRLYANLTTDSERLGFMRQYAHEKMPVVFPTWRYYEDPIAGKEYSILIDSLEGREVDVLMGNLDESLGRRLIRGC